LSPSDCQKKRERKEKREKKENETFSSFQRSKQVDDVINHVDVRDTRIDPIFKENDIN